ncbi:MAG: N-6 DNA methylase [Planctomycetota bacterium]|nr:N-6 DNA methylase [Planctomycetota bacterium]
MRNLPAHLSGLRAYMTDWRRQFGLDTEDAVFRALSQDSQYDFACLTPDMLGPFYQAALMRDPATGEVDKEKRKLHGVFYTSRRITQLILDRLPIEEIDPEGRFLLDPTCGSGSFLMAGEQRLSELIRPRRLSDAEKAARASGFIQGNDRDTFAVLVARLQLVLDKPDSECQYRFTEIDIEFDRSSGASIGVPYVNRPSIIVGNPPFLRHDKVEERAALFLHAAANEWLRDGGLLGLVLPATFLSGTDRCRTVREAVLESCELLEVWDLPRNILSDEKDGNGGTNGGDIESCVVLLRKRKASQNLVSFCRVLSVDRSVEARKLFRHKGCFSSHGLCVTARDWGVLPESRWWASALAPTLRRLCESPQCVTVKDVCQLRNGIQRTPEKPVKAKSAPTREHVPWLQTAQGMRAFSLTVWQQNITSDYIRYPGKMRWPRLEWATRDSNTGDELGEREWRKNGVFSGRKILIHKTADPASTRPLRAFIDVGHFPSDNFHFAWLDPRLPEGNSWTYEALLAILNAPVSQLCLSLARTRNNPTDVIESIPIPKLDRKSIIAISREVSAILAADADDNERRTARLESLDRQILGLYPLSEWEKDLLWHMVHGSVCQEDHPLWTDAPWPVHGVVEAIREADEDGPSTIRIRVPAFRRGAQIYGGPIPLEMPGWAMVAGIEFQAEIPWPDAEACVFDPLKVRRFRPLPFAYEAAKTNGRS